MATDKGTPRSTPGFSITVDGGKAAQVDWLELLLSGKYKFERYDKDTGYIWMSKVMQQ